MSLLLASLLKGSVVLALALGAAAFLRRRSAACRHAILAAGIGAACLMPAFERVLPDVPILRLQDPTAFTSSGLMLASDAGGPDEPAGHALPRSGIPFLRLFAFLWLAGALATGGAFLIGLARLGRLRARCTPAPDDWRRLADALARDRGTPRRVALLQSDHPSLLVTCGILKPAIILPAGASAWSEDRRRVVLLHELAHVRRHDAAIQLAGEALRIVQWLNPLVWIACRRLRQESEYACDDAVLARGVSATAYARHLLDVARDLSRRHTAWAAAPAIAHPSTLERRIVAMLHTDRNRAPLGRRGWIAAALAALAVTLPVAAAGIAAGAGNAAQAVNSGPAAFGPAGSVTVDSAGGLPAGQGTARLEGQVLDPSGGVMPGTQVTLGVPGTDASRSATTDASGRFAFDGLAPGGYSLMARMPGFKTATQDVMVPAGSPLRVTVSMPLGTLQETVTLACAAPGASARPLPGWLPWRSPGAPVMNWMFPPVHAQERVRVGGNIRPPRKTRDVKPVCPPEVPPGETLVRVIGTVGEDGRTRDLTAVPPETGAGPPIALVEAALDAVRQWIFTPTLLNQQPVEVGITVDVIFRKP